MIRFLPYIYIIRDKKYEDDSKEILNDLENFTKHNSAVGYFTCRKTICSLSDLLKKNNDEYNRLYKVNLNKFIGLKEKIEWEFVPPFTDFELPINSLFNEIQALLEDKNYFINSQAKNILETADIAVRDYIERSHLVDKELRCKFHNKLNEIKKTIFSDSLISILMRNNELKKLEEIFRTNEEKYQKYYQVIIQKFEPVKQSFLRLKPYFSNKEAYSIEEQFGNIEYILQSQNFESFEEAEEILSMAEFKLSEIVEQKRSVISKNLENELNNLRAMLWSEDWNDLKEKTEELVKDSYKTGYLDKLNFDKFGLEHKKAEKKEMIYKLLKTIETSNSPFVKAIAVELAEFLEKEKSRKDFEELETRLKENETAEKKNNPVSHKEYYRILKYVIIFILLSVSVSALFINHKKNSVHFDAKGQKYADIIETMIYVQIQKGQKVNLEQIRNKILAPQNELKIVSADDKEVVISFRNKIYRKNIRKK